MLDSKGNHQREQRSQITERARYLREGSIAKRGYVVAVALAEVGEDGHGSGDASCEATDHMKQAKKAKMSKLMQRWGLFEVTSRLRLEQRAPAPRELWGRRRRPFQHYNDG